MNRWAANNPELYEQLGHDGYVDYFREAADMERKRQKEEWADPGCSTCRGIGRVPRPKTADHILTDTQPWERCPDCAE